jgi:probable rRNA maturation factor
MTGPAVETIVSREEWGAHIGDADAFAVGVVAVAVSFLPQIASPDDVACCVNFSGDDETRRLNAEFLGKDKPTNVLSFPSELYAPADAVLPKRGYLGDVILAFETVRAEAERDGVGVRDHAAHLLAHGFLHLLGYDHAEDGDAEIMEGLEIRILAALGIADPYADAGAHRDC